MHPHGKKTAGVVLSVLAVLLPLALQGAAVLWAWRRLGMTPLFWGLAGLLLAAAILIIAAALVRLREIKGGEEDDLSQY
ncbi:MAG: hypothetical protein MR286_01845 [Clostridiales bacterium]|nr:hypothetical protein [Clostridiales bacterium]